MNILEGRKSGSGKLNEEAISNSLVFDKELTSKLKKTVSRYIGGRDGRIYCWLV